MYKWLLCWRYLLTRYLALVSIISVMLGVATLIIVNSVMSGFATKLTGKLKGMQADVIITHRSAFGFRHLSQYVNLIQQRVGDKIDAISPVVESFGIFRFNVGDYNTPIQMPVRIIGVDPKTRSLTSDFANYLDTEENRKNPANCFELSGKALELFKERKRVFGQPLSSTPFPETAPPPATSPIQQTGGEDPQLPPIDKPAMLQEELKPIGIIVGYNIARNRRRGTSNDQPKDMTYIKPGDVVHMILMARDDVRDFQGQQSYSKPFNWSSMVVTDYLKSGMSEIDSMFVFLHIEDMQKLQVMPDAATSLQIKLKDPALEAQVLQQLHELFPDDFFKVETWRDRCGPILAAITMERSILNILLFLIIAVAGFGILAIFFMIVMEKTRDIGIMKALGAPSKGIMGIFMGYGLLLGVVGAGLGTIGGITFVCFINEIEQLLSMVSGVEVFPRDMYYFDKIPTNTSFWTVIGINAGAILIAVAASVLPAIRAAMLRPVQALRFE